MPEHRVEVRESDLRECIEWLKDLKADWDWKRGSVERAHGDEYEMLCQFIERVEEYLE